MASLRRIQHFGIVKKVRIVKNPRYLVALLEHYTDESKKDTYIDPVVAQALIPRARYGQAVDDGRAPLRPGIDYVPLPGPKLRFYGYLRHVLSTFFPDPDQADPEEVVAALKAWWLRTTADRQKKCYHYVFSLHPAVSAELNRAGVSVDSVLLDCTARAFEVFAARFHPDDVLGYVAGVHHDRAHPHLHVLLYPKTAGGKRISVGYMQQVRTGPNETMRVDFQGALHAAYVDECAKVCAALGLVPASPARSKPSQKEVAGDILLAVAASRKARLAAPDRKPTAQEIIRARNEVEASGAPGLREIQQEIAGAFARDRLSGDYLNTIRQGFDDIRSKLAAAREARMAAFRTAMAARKKGIEPLFDFELLPHRIGYSPKTPRDYRVPANTAREAIPALLERHSANMQDRQQALQNLIDAWPGSQGGAVGVAQRALVGANDLACFCGQRMGRAPTYLQGDFQVPSAVDARSRFNEHLAAIIERNGFELRPFTAEELGNKCLSPYRRAAAIDQTGHSDPDEDFAQDFTKPLGNVRSPSRPGSPRPATPGHEPQPEI